MSKLVKFDVIQLRDAEKDIIYNTENNITITGYVTSKMEKVILADAFVIIAAAKGMIVGYNKKYLQCVIMKQEIAKSIKKEPIIQVTIKEDEFNTLIKREMNGGVFYHKLSKMFEKIYENTPMFVAFIHPTTRAKIIFKLSKAEKVIKTIGYESNDSYQKIRVVTPMIKLILADRIL